MVFSGNIRRMATVMTAEDNASGTLRRVQAQADSTSDSMRGTAGASRSMMSVFQGTALAAGALAAGLVQLTRTTGRVNQTFARLQEVSGATNQQMETLRSTAVGIGQDLPISIRQAAGAMEQLAFAGFNANEAMQASRSVANLAVASQLNMKESARSLAGTLRMFQLEADQTIQVTSAMAATFASSSTNIQEISGAIERVGATAQIAGVSIQEVSAAIGVMADRGFRGRRAGTALNNTLRNLATGTDSAVNALNRMGVELEEIRDAQGGLKNLSTVMATLSEGFQNLESDAARMQAAVDIAGRRGARALIPLIENSEDLSAKMGDIFRSEIQAGIGSLANMTEEEMSGVEDALGFEVSEDMTGEQFAQQLQQLSEEGASAQEISLRLQSAFGVSAQAANALAEDVKDGSTSVEQISEALGGAQTAAGIAAAQADTAAGAFTFLKSSLDTLAFTIFSGAAPALQTIFKQLGLAVNAIGSMEGVTKALGAGLVALTGALGAVAAVTGAQVAASMVSASIAGGALQGTLLASVASAGSLSAALGVLGSALASAAAAAAPVIAIVGAIAGAIYLVVEAIKSNFLGVGEDFQNIMQGINDLLGFLKPILDATVEGFIILAKVLAVVAGSPIAAVIIGLIKVLSLLVDVLDFLLAPIGEFIASNKALVDVIGFVIATAGTAIALFAAAGPIIGTLASIFGTLVSVLGTVVSVGGTILSVLGTVISVITTVVSVVASLVATLNPVSLAIIAIVGAIIGLLAYFGVLDDVIGAIITGFDMLINAILAIPGALVGLGQAIIDVFMNPMEFLRSIPGMVAGVGGAIIDALVGGLKAGIDAVVGAIKGVVDAIASFLPFSNAERGPLSSIMGVGGSIIDAIAGGLKAGIDVVVGAAKAVAGAIGGVLGGIADTAKGLAKGAVGAVSAGLNAGKELAGDAASAVTGVIKDPLSAPEEFIGLGADAADAIGDGIKGATDAVANAVSGIPIVGDVAGVANQAINGAVNMGQDIVNGLAGALKSGVSAVKSAAGQIGSAITGALSGVASTAANIGSNIAGGIADGISGAAGAVSSAANTVVGGATDVVGGAANMATDAGSAVGDAVASGVDSATDTVSSAASDVAGAIGGALPGSDADFGPLSNLTQVGPDLVNTIASGMRNEQGTLMSSAANAMQGALSAVQGTPLGQAVTGAVGEVAPGAVPGQSGPGGPEDGGPTDGVTVEINQEINLGSDADGTPQELREAAEQGTSKAVQDTITELERLLQQEMNG